METNRVNVVRIIAGLMLASALAGILWRLDKSEISGVAGTAVESAKPSTDAQSAQNGSITGEPVQATASTSTSTAKIEASPFLRELAAALESIEAEPNILEREKKLQGLAEGIATSDIALVVEFLNERGSKKVVRYLTLRLIHRWAGSDPQTVADWLDQNAGSPLRREALNSVAAGWANKDLATAIEWARQFTDGGERGSTLITVAYEAARTEPVEALQLAAEMPPNQARDDLVAHTVNQWATKDPKAALEWANESVDEGLRERLLADIVTTWAENNPMEAATVAVRTVNPGKQQDDAVVGVVQRWVQTDPEQAAAWVNAFPD